MQRCSIENMTVSEIVVVKDSIGQNKWISSMYCSGKKRGKFFNIYNFSTYLAFKANKIIGDTAQFVFFFFFYIGRDICWI